MAGGIDQLIINGPYGEPERHWRYERESRTFSLEPGRRPAGYVVATPGSKAFDDPGVFVPLPLVNRIRPRVEAWREAGYPGVTGTTLRLLQHWRDPETWQERRFFFCQLEAVETLIWLAEAPAGDRQGIEVPGDGGPFTRLRAKMATGSGKTLVMAMVIAWHVLNRVANEGTEPDDDERPARKLTREEQAERLRVQVDTVGQPGKPGERIQNVISVGMLPEGWDARTVTHIMGLRAFSTRVLLSAEPARWLVRDVAVPSLAGRSCQDGTARGGGRWRRPRRPLGFHR